MNFDFKIIQKGIVRNETIYTQKYYAMGLQQLAILKQFMSYSNINVLSRIVNVGNGVKIHCEVNFLRESINIILPEVIDNKHEDIRTEIYYSGIICHPRSGPIQYFSFSKSSSDGIVTSAEYFKRRGVGGGWEYGDTELIGASYDSLFPLIDDDRASFLIGTSLKQLFVNDKKANSPILSKVSQFIEPGAYGNLYWTNNSKWDDETLSWDKKFESVSWKGTPTRHFRVPTNYNIPLLSILASSHYGAFDDVNTYTTFGTELYKSGSVYLDAPSFSWPENGGSVNGKSLILGANTNYIITLNDHMEAPNYFWCFSDGTSLSGNDKQTVSDYLSSVNDVLPNPDPPTKLLSEFELESPGYFLGIWTNIPTLNSDRSLTFDKIRTNGWELIGETRYSRNGLPWFSDQTMQNFVCSNGDKIEISRTDIDPQILNDRGFVTYNGNAGTATYTLTKISQPEGTYVEEKPSKANFYINNPSTPLYHEYVDNEINSVNGVFSANVTSGYNTHTFRINLDIDIKSGNNILTVPMLNITRDFNVESGSAEHYDPCHLKEDYNITISTLHYLNISEGICLYKKVYQYVKFDITSTERTQFKGTWGQIYGIKIKIYSGPDKNYDAKTITEWHLIKDGEDNIVASSEEDFSPFPDTWLGSYEPFSQDYVYNYYTRMIIVIPQPPSLATPWEDDVRALGFYDYGNYPGFESELNALDGGWKDLFYPQWCREFIQTSPILEAIRDRRYNINWFHVDIDEGSAYLFPEITVDPIPCGDYAKHPQVGELYQFLCDGTVVGSDGVEEKINKSLANGLTTHDTTLFFPISII